MRQIIFVLFVLALIVLMAESRLFSPEEVLTRLRRGCQCTRRPCPCDIADPYPFTVTRLA